MNFQKVKTIDKNIYQLDMDRFGLIECGNGYFYINTIHIDQNILFSMSKKNFAPYYEMLGTLVVKEPNDGCWRAVTTSVSSNIMSLENALGMTGVFVPTDMTEWIGYWTGGEGWIFVEILYPEKPGFGVKPRVNRRLNIPAPTLEVSFAHFAEDRQGKLFVVQGFSRQGSPVFVSPNDTGSGYYIWPPNETGQDFPFPLLPRKVIEPNEPKKGTIYAYDDELCFLILN